MGKQAAARKRTPDGQKVKQKAAAPNSGTPRTDPVAVSPRPPIEQAAPEARHAPPPRLAPGMTYGKHKELLAKSSKEEELTRKAKRVVKGRPKYAPASPTTKDKKKRGNKARTEKATAAHILPSDSDGAATRSASSARGSAKAEVTIKKKREKKARTKKATAAHILPSDSDGAAARSASPTRGRAKAEGAINPCYGEAYEAIASFALGSRQEDDAIKAWCDNEAPKLFTDREVKAKAWIQAEKGLETLGFNDAMALAQAAYRDHMQPDITKFEATVREWTTRIEVSAGEIVEGGGRGRKGEKGAGRGGAKGSDERGLDGEHRGGGAPRSSGEGRSLSDDVGESSANNSESENSENSWGPTESPVLPNKFVVKEKHLTPRALSVAKKYMANHPELDKDWPAAQRGLHGELLAMTSEEATKRGQGYKFVHDKLYATRVPSHEGHAHLSRILGIELNDRFLEAAAKAKAAKRKDNETKRKAEKAEKAAKIKKGGAQEEELDSGVKGRAKRKTWKEQGIESEKRWGADHPQGALGEEEMSSGLSSSGSEQRKRAAETVSSDSEFEDARLDKMLLGDASSTSRSLSSEPSIGAKKNKGEELQLGNEDGSYGPPSSQQGL